MGIVRDNGRDEGRERREGTEGGLTQLLSATIKSMRSVDPEVPSSSPAPSLSDESEPSSQYVTQSMEPVQHATKIQKMRKLLADACPFEALK